MKIKITLLCNHLAYGGAARCISLFARLLVDAGYDVTVLTYYPNDNEYQLDSRITRDNLINSKQDYLEHPHNKMVIKKLLEDYLIKHSTHLLISFLVDCNLIASLCNHIFSTTVIQTIRNSPWDKEFGFKLILRDWAIRRQGSVILQNNEQAEYFNSPEYKHVKKYIVHNPLNPEILKIKKETYRPIKKIITVGRFVSQKNHTLMIEAIKILRDEYHENYELDIYGDGELRDDLQSQINQYHLDDQVKLRGYDTDIFNILINYDLFLMTSLYEGTPNALLEAMGLGLPSLAIKCRTGITELIDNGKNGYILESYDAHDLAEKIHLINNQTQLEKIGKQARQDMITRYSPSIIQAELVSVIEDLYNNPPKTKKVSLKNALKKLSFKTTSDYQNYFESSLDLIGIADYPLAKQFFNHARKFLQAKTLDTPTATKRIYNFLLRQNEFNVFYEFLHTDCD